MNKERDPAQRDNIAAVVLCAGKSQRMGAFKPLLPLGDKPLLARTLDNLMAAGDIGPILLVTGHGHAEITAALQNYTVRCVLNPNFSDGQMLFSVQTGVRALSSQIDAFFLVLGDQPFVPPSVFQQLQDAQRASDAKIVIPTFAQRRGHPVLFAARCRDEILQLSNAEPLKTYVRRQAAHTCEVPVACDAVLFDVDTPDDYRHALERWEMRAARD